MFTLNSIEGVGHGKLDEGGQKVKTSSYKMHKYWVMHNMITVVNTDVWYVIVCMMYGVFESC